MLNKQWSELIQKTILPIQGPKFSVEESQNQDLQEKAFSNNEPPTKKKKKKEIKRGTVKQYNATRVKARNFLTNIR